MAEHNIAALERILRPMADDQMVTVVLAGPTGTGKSSLIANLTNGRLIKIGDGVMSRRLECGFGWHTIGRPDEDRLIISMLLCPYLAASNLCVLMHLGGLERGSVDAFVTLMEAATTIRSELNSAHQTQDSMDIVDVLAGVSQYETGRNDKDWPLLFREQSILPATCRESRLVISLQYLIVLLYSLELILTCIRLS